VVLTRTKAEPKVFAPGARVVVRDEEWLVRTTRSTSTGGSAVHVTGLSPLIRNKQAIFLTELDEVTELRPEDTRLVADLSPQYRRSRLYLETLLRRTPPTDARLYIGHRAAMNFAPYQFVPAAKALQQARPRILIADGVGLGKTLEVGVLLTELARRGRADRILVVALKSILTQFQQEMWARFTIPLVRLDSIGLQRVQAKIPSNMNPFYYFNRVIISIDTLKKDEKYRRFLEDSHWDVIVVDECQHVAERGTGKRSQRSRLASLLARRCDSLILTSATPHDGRPESFASLMNLLDPTAVANPAEYTREDVQGLFVRRFKKDIADQVVGQFQERSGHPHHVSASTPENNVFDQLGKIEFRTIDRQRGGGGVLFRTTLLKAFLSSPVACARTVDERMKQRVVRDLTSPDAAHDREVLSDLLELLESCRVFPKFDRLCQLLGEFGYKPGSCGERVVIFAERIDTLKYLQEELTNRYQLKPRQIAVFHGSLQDVEQEELRSDFGAADGKIRILLASDAASEGINLHFFCHRLVHFDIPWSLITLEQRNGRIDRYGQQQVPHLHYLLTVPTHPGLKGDLRVLDRLIEKEQAAHKNLGDVAWLLDLHDVEKEEQRIALGIQEHEAAERIVPEKPPNSDFLALLMQVEEEAPQEEAVQTVDPTTLYRDDLSYVREAWDELAVSDDDSSALEWQDHASGFTLTAPSDLRYRFSYLPPEITPKDWEFRLTVDRKRMAAVWDQCRQKEGQWPDWQLFWNLHPIAEWLNDQVLGLFPRHEAPVIQVPRGLRAGETAYVFQGVLSNLRSQPVVVDWFAVIQQDGAARIEPFEALAHASGLTAPVSNPEVSIIPLSTGLSTAVSRAREHMVKLRQEHADRLRGLLNDEDTRIARWQRESLRRLENSPSRDSRRLEQERRRIDETVQDRRESIEHGLQTVDAPYLRLAVVLVPKE
jgi:superfamily II DNA or RNA helicase